MSRNNNFSQRQSSKTKKATAPPCETAHDDQISYAVHLAIKKQFGVVLPLRTISDYLKRWGFTPQKPVKRAYELDPKKVQIWLDKTYPAIAASAKKEKGEIHWGDENGIVNNAFNAKGFAPQGQPPIIQLSAKKWRVKMMSSITDIGRFALCYIERT